MNAADNEYIEWDDHRLGLGYARYRNIVHYYPNAPFYVDGICYQASNGGPLCRRVMIELIDDGGGDATMRSSPPPTDSELDHFVETGIFDGWRQG